MNSFPWQDFSCHFPDFWSILWHFSDSSQMPDISGFSR